MSRPIITGRRDLALAGAVLALGLSWALFADAYRGRRTPFPIKIITPTG